MKHSEVDQRIRIRTKSEEGNDNDRLTDPTCH